MSIQHFQCVGVPFYHTAALLGKHQETISGYFLCQFKVISSCGTTNMKEEFFSYCVCYSDSLLNLYWCNSYTLKMLDGHIIEVNFFLLHKATRKVFAICQKFVPLGSILKNRMHHIQTFKPLTLFVFL
jgi:hypothetical protein